MRKLFLLYRSFLTHFCSSVGINYDFLKILGLSKQCILNNFHCLLVHNPIKLLMMITMLWQSKDAEVMLKLGSTPDKREQYRLMRDAMEKRFIRVTRGSIVGGVRLGMFTAAFYTLQNFFAEKRGVHDVFNIAGAGSLTAATFGLISKNS